MCDLAAELTESAKRCATFSRDAAQRSLRRTECHLEESRALMFARDTDATAARTRFRVLVVRGVRRDVQRVCTLGRSLAAVGVRGIDAILLPGNLADLPRPGAAGGRACGHAGADEEQSECAAATAAAAAATRAAAGEGDASNILSLFEHISLRVFYVPGTHRDPMSMARRERARGEEEEGDEGGDGGLSARTPPKLTNLSVNVHGWWVELEEGIVLAGFGSAVVGGVAGLLSDVRAHHAARRAEANANAANAANAAPLQILLMTHVAPECEGKGSRSGGVSEGEMLRRVLLESEVQDTVLVSVAGEDDDDDDDHAKDLAGIRRSVGSVGTVPVVHPGSLSGGGHYALLTFEKTAPTGPWSLTETLFKTIADS
jgi:hypothetical protein